MTYRDEWLYEVENDIANHYGVEADGIDITHNGNPFNLHKLPSGLPRRLIKKQLIEAFTEPLLQPDEQIAHPKGVEETIVSLQSMLVADQKPFSVVTGRQFVGKTTVIQNLAKAIEDPNGKSVRFLSGRTIMRILPEVSGIAVTPVKEAFDKWERDFGGEDCSGIMLYTDNQAVASEILAMPSLSIPLVIEAGEDFNFERLNGGRDGIKPMLTLVADPDIRENMRVMRSVVADREEEYLRKFGWSPSRQVIDIITRAMSYDTSAYDFKFNDVLSVLEGMCSEYAAKHTHDSIPNARDAFKFLKTSFGIDRKLYDSIPDTLPLRSERESDSAKEIMNSLGKALGIEMPSLEKKVQKEVGSFDFTFTSKNDLIASIQKQVIGQEDAIKRIVMPIVRRKAGLSDPHKPIASLLLAGPSGVGKTETAKAVARAVFGSEQEMIRIDCSELGSEHMVSRLIGSPAGYVGHDEGGQLTQFVIKHPNAVILFDEIEKAHPKIYDSILLQLLDAGRLTDSKDGVVDCSNTIVILTSNLGSQKVGDKGMNSHGFASSTVLTNESTLDKEVMSAITENFRTEQINRFDDVIVFRPLTLPELSQIVSLKWKPFQKRLADKGIIMELPEEVAEWFAHLSRKDKFGARNLMREMDRLLVNPLADIITTGKANDTILIKVNETGDDLLFTDDNGKVLEAQ